MPRPFRLPLAAALYFALALTSAMTSAMLTPPTQVPDEVAHFFYAEGIATGQMMAHPLPEGGAGMALPKAANDLALAFVPLNFHPERKATAQMFAAAAAANATQPVNADLTTSALYPPVAYAVPALGLATGHALGFSMLQSFYIGRLFNALFFALLTALAIALLPAGRLAVAAVLLLPMVSFEAGSYSADNFVIAGSVLLCALIARWATTDRPPPIAGLVGGTLLAILLASTKLPMIALSLPLAALAARRSPMHGLGIIVIVAAAVVAWVLLFSGMTAYMALDLQGPLAHRSVTGQLLWIVQHPGDFAATVTRTFSLRWLDYTYATIGVLGWLDAPLPGWYYSLAYFALLAAALSALTTQSASGTGVRIAFLLGTVGGIPLVFLVLYLAWTGVGGAEIAGVQGRYFLPFLPALLLGLTGWVRLPRAVPLAFGGIAIGVWGASYFAMTTTLLARYYTG